MTAYLSRLWYRFVLRLLVLEILWRRWRYGTTWEEEAARLEREIARLDSRS